MTGVQTCALPILCTCKWERGREREGERIPSRFHAVSTEPDVELRRSEERRVGKECVFAGVRGREREGERIPSRLRAVSAEPKKGFEFMNREIMT